MKFRVLHDPGEPAREHRRRNALLRERAALADEVVLAIQRKVATVERRHGIEPADARLVAERATRRRRKADKAARYLDREDVLQLHSQFLLNAIENTEREFASLEARLDVLREDDDLDETEQDELENIPLALERLEAAHAVLIARLNKLPKRLQRRPDDDE